MRALLEAAKGKFVYVNIWSKSPAQPWDLVAAVMLVRGAGGDVVDIQGSPVDALGHQGPFVAGVDKEARAKVLSLVSRFAASEA